MAPGTPNSPFNFIQVIIAALGCGYLNVITFFIGGSAGASMKMGADEQTVGFAQVLAFTWIPLVVLGFIVFLIGRAKKGVTKLAQWVGLIVAVVTAIFPIMQAADFATGLTLALLHVFTGVAWFFAVHYGNKELHTASSAVAVA